MSKKPEGIDVPKTPAEVVETVDDLQGHFQELKEQKGKMDSATMESFLKAALGLSAASVPLAMIIGLLEF